MTPKDALALAIRGLGLFALWSAAQDFTWALAVWAHVDVESKYPLTTHLWFTNINLIYAVGAFVVAEPLAKFLIPKSVRQRTEEVS